MHQGVHDYWGQVDLELIKEGGHIIIVHVHSSFQMLCIVYYYSSCTLREGRVYLHIICTYI